MHELHNAAMFMGCVGYGVAHAIPWKVVLGPLALVVAGVVFGVRRVKK
jgi:hypothetical protein